VKITYAATEAEMTDLSQLLLKRHRGRIALRFTEDGVVAEVETPAAAPASNLEEAFEALAAEPMLSAA
jgi:hypothetical protein